MHRLRELFSASHQASASPLGRLDARLKLFPVLAAVVAIMFCHQATLPLALLAASATLAVAMGLRPGVLLLRLAAPAVLAGTIWLLRMAVPADAAAQPLAHLELGGWTIHLAREGFHSGGLIFCRVVSSVCLLIVLGSFTPSYRVFAALRWAKMPRTWVELAMLMYRYIFVFYEQAVSVRSAQRVRLAVGSGWRRSIASAGSLAGVVSLRAIDQADHTHEAMMVRGCRGRMRILPLLPLGWRNWVALGASLVVLAAAWTVCERWAI